MFKTDFIFGNKKMSLNQNVRSDHATTMQQDVLLHFWMIFYAEIILLYYLLQWEKLADAQTWLRAGTQIFFSLGLGFGGLIAYSSYNPANNNLKRDAIFVAITNCSTSVFAGIIIFAILGECNLQFIPLYYQQLFRYSEKVPKIWPIFHL